MTFATQAFAPSLSTTAIFVVRCLTSPFNAYFEGGYWSNIAVVFVILLIAEIYFKARKQDRTIKIGFAAAIMASYEVSISTIIDHGVPSAGSSIVAEAILLTLLASVAIDLIKRYRSLLRHRVSSKVLLNSFILIGFEIAIIYFIGAFYYGAYLLSNPSWGLHIIGLIVYLILFRYISRKGYFKR